MTLPLIQETTLYPEIVNYLINNGFDAIGETKTITGKRPDILFQYEGISFVVEIKIGKPEISASATAQAFGYAKELETNNVIIIIYPSEKKNQTIENQEFVRNYALKSKTNCLILTDLWIEHIELTVEELVEILKVKLKRKEVDIDFNTVVKLINIYVTNLNEVINKVNRVDLINEVVDKLDLFSSIGAIKNKEVANQQVVNLASFLFFNQLLFYHIFNKKNKSNELEELKLINSISDIQKYFDNIQLIDYKAIYRVNILGHIPNIPIVITTINEVITSIKSLRAEHITHDLAGRFFHDLIPFEVRKVLAAFYTHPNAADILAGLVINSYDQSVIDPACGSGTLLVAAYKQKEYLFKQVYGLSNLDKMHKKFIEEDITGIDIMPFAAHISTINLTTQNIEQNTNKVRFATQDSLELANILSTEKMPGEGFYISAYMEVIQKTLFDASEQKYTKGAISPDNENGGFFLKPFDRVIMNPPFSDREKIPKSMQDKLNDNFLLNQHCGNLVNLWGYFLILGDLLLKEEGILGAVIPINFARGKATEQIREFIISNHHIKYIVKQSGDLAFSEGAAFRDILLVTEKRKPNDDDKTKIVYIKQSIKSYKNGEIQQIVNLIKRSPDKQESSIFDSIDISYQELRKYQNNLMHFLWANKLKTYLTIREFYEEFKTKKIIDFPENFVLDCFNSAGFKGLIDATFITHPMNEKSRIERAFMVYESEDKDNVFIRLKNTGLKFEVPKSVLKKALRTLTGVRTIEIGKEHDYFIIENFEELKKILMFSKIRDKNNFDTMNIKNRLKNKFVHLVFAIKFDIYSPNTSFLSLYSENLFIQSDVFKVIPNIKKNHAKIICLFYNSIVNLLQIFSNKSTTTGHYGLIRETDLLQFKLIDYKNLSDKTEKSLLEFFNKIKKIKFPSILEQIEKRFPARVEMDIIVMQALGYKMNEINKLLPELYKIIIDEIKHN